MFSHVRVGVLSMLVLAILATSAIRCDCDGQVQCYEASDCSGREWTKTMCTEEEGYWTCFNNLCGGICGQPACTQTSDCETMAWPVDAGCAETAGHWECTGSVCEAICDEPECTEATDCDGMSWPGDAGCAEADGHWACTDNLCDAVCEQPQCTEAVDCDGEAWPAEAECDQADGHWECDGGSCTAVCDPDCVVYQDCAGGTWPPIDDIDCYADEGHWECDQGECVAVCNLDCNQDDQCESFIWQEACVGNWDCIQGLCEEACDPVGCGDNTCDAAGGETEASCPDDCVAPCTVPADCVGQGEWDQPCDGRWTCVEGVCTSTCDYSTCGDGDCNSTVGEDAASCVPDCLGACQSPLECAQNGTWEKICQGRFTCFMGNCNQTCDSNGCGNDTCDGALGETADSCFTDCLGGWCQQVTDCLGLRWYDSNCPQGGHWECQQPAGACEAVCESDTCGDGFCDVLAGEASTGCPTDCQEWDCNLSADCDGLTLPDGCDAWLCSHRNCVPICQ